MIGCSRCRRYAAMMKDLKRYGYICAYNCTCNLGAFNVTAAELIIKLSRRKPEAVTARSIDQWYRIERWITVKRHLPHVDNRRPGIVVNLGTEARPRPFLIEGFHRAENHRRDRTNWSCYFLTPAETFAIFTKA